MAKRKNQSDHDKMLAGLVKALKDAGHKEIKADHLKGYDQPDIIIFSKTKAAHIPDATCTTNGTHYIFEVETDDSITDEHTDSQWKTFSEYAEREEGAFIVIVPKGCESQALARAKQLEIELDGVWPSGSR